VVNSVDGTLSVVDTATNTVSATIPGLTNPFLIAITPNGAFAYVTNILSGTVAVVDTATNTVTATIPVGVSPRAIDITPNGAFAYVANFESGTVSVIDTATNTVIATVSVPSASGVAVRPDGAFTYVTSFQSSTVAVIDTTTNTVTGSITVGAFPNLIAFPRRANPINSLIAQVQALVAAGNLTQNQAAGLIDKLVHIKAKLDNGQTTAACNQLGPFINQVTAFINNGSLTAKIALV
jgi:YVTN family beta-propeller protein